MLTTSNYNTLPAHQRTFIRSFVKEVKVTGNKAVLSYSMPVISENAAKHYKELRYLTGILIAGLDALIERRIGQANMATLKSRFER